MNIENLTCKQYINLKMAVYKKSKYYQKTLELKRTKPELANKLIIDKENKFKEEWQQYILEYGKSNKLKNKIIYSYIKEFGYNRLLYDFRRVKALEGWIPTEKYTIGFNS